MTSDSLPKHQPSVPSAATLKSLILKDDRTYIPKPPMQEEKSTVWFSQILIPYSLYGNVHAFMSPLPQPNKKLHNSENFFPNFPTYKPLVLEDATFYISFMRRSVFRSSPSTNDPSYISWFDRVQQKKGKVWKDQGIFDLYNSQESVLSICLCWNDYPHAL